MKLNFFKSIPFLFLLMGSATAYSQDKSIDSIQKIINKIQDKFGSKKAIPGIKSAIPGMDTIPGLGDNFDGSFTEKTLKGAFEDFKKDWLRHKLWVTLQR